MTLMTDRIASPAEFAAAPVIEFLPALLLDGETPRDGHLLWPFEVRRGDFLLDADRAVWSLVTEIVMIEGRWSIWCPGWKRPMHPTQGLRLWVLRSHEAMAQMRGVDAVARPYGPSERAMEDVLREFPTKPAVLAGWRFDDPPAPQAADAWELLMVADALNGTPGVAL